MRLIAIATAAALVLGAVLVAQSGIGTSAFIWAIDRQREFQNAMAGALQAIRGGDRLAVFGLCALSAGYGFVHALGPGHGKMVLGGAAASGTVPMRRMLVIGLLASLAQAGTAILLVAIGVKLLAFTSDQAIALSEGTLAALSYMAIAVIGLVIALRGFRKLWVPSHHHHDGCGCGHSHGPSATDVERAASPWAAAALIGSVAIRPCSGALFLLVIAWRFGIAPQGILAVVAMGLGTAAFNMLAITGGGAMRRIGGTLGETRWTQAVAQLAAGGIIALLAGGMAVQFL